LLQSSQHTHSMLINIFKAALLENHRL
jgi:hypothetical protein